MTALSPLYSRRRRRYGCQHVHEHRTVRVHVVDAAVPADPDGCRQTVCGDMIDRHGLAEQQRTDGARFTRCRRCHEATA